MRFFVLSIYSITQMNTKYKFPDPSLANDQGLLAHGGDLHPNRIIAAYRSGIFPWYNKDSPILWWSPNPRMVLFPEKLHISKSMRPYFNQQKFKVTYNQDFKAVIKKCASVYRKGQNGTWLIPEMIKAYTQLHEMGWAHSVEVWKAEKLVAGLYGVYLQSKHIFCGESMFSKKSNASKFGFISLVKKLQKEGVRLIDCQVHSTHLARLGAEEIPRDKFLTYLK